MALALDDNILMSVDKPARYIGHEINSVIKNKEDVAIRFAMCFPDVYEIGMSHIGLQILYSLINGMEDAWCERVFSPWIDMDRVMRENHIPLFALESQDPIKDFDFLAITIQYEMCYTNILQVLDLSQIPLRAVDRTNKHPIVIGGGPCTYNPEPIADFFDIFYIGEGETQYRALFDLYKKYFSDKNIRKSDDKKQREDFLIAASQIPGMYVPSLYDVEYNADGTIKSVTPNTQGVPSIIKREVVSDMEDVAFIDNPIVPFIKVTQDRVVLEIQRGCIRGCRFCQAGYIYRPLRERSLEFLEKSAIEMLEATGQEEISLSSLSSSDYRYLEELINFLIDYTSRNHINISLPSLRIDAFSIDVMSRVQDIKKSSLTFAPEAGTQRLRDVINKGLTEESILSGAKEAFIGGWNKVKLYFMLGLPTETYEDRIGIMELCEKIAEEYYEIPKSERNGKVQISASSSFFVPKPFTAFQWAPMYTQEDYLSRAYDVKDHHKTLLNKKSIKYSYHDAEITVLEGIFARGDRRLSDFIEAVYKKGSIYDAWTEHHSSELWAETFADCGVDIDFYTTRARGLDEIFPWDHIDIGVKKEYLIQEWKEAVAEKVTPNCRERCTACGATCFKGGVCFEGKS